MCKETSWGLFIASYTIDLSENEEAKRAWTVRALKDKLKKGGE